MNLAMVRHAEPERIESGTGIPANPQLTANGREQAARLADWLAGERVEVVVSSPQRRAIETAEPVARAHGLTVEVVDGLVEMDVQLDHYIPVEELKATNDDRWHAMVQGRFHDYGGEDPVLFRNRVAAAVDEIQSDDPRFVDAHFVGSFNGFPHHIEQGAAGVLGLVQRVSQH